MLSLRESLMSSQTTAPKWALIWLVPRQRVLFGLIVFLFGTLFIRTIFFVSTSPNQPDIHKIAEREANMHTSPSQIVKNDKINDSRKWVPKFMQFQQTYRLSKKSSIEMCVIDGNMPEFFTAIMCFVYDPAKFKEANRSVYSETSENRFCKDSNEAEKFNEIPEKWLHLAAVRDPLERFTESFNRICIKESKCGECASNFTCFLELEYNRALKYAADPVSLQLNELDKLFFPQNWNCEFSKHLNNYTLLKIEQKDENHMKLLNDLFFRFREKEIDNDDLSHIYKQINEPLVDAEKQVVEEAGLQAKLRSDKNALKVLIALYYYDFMLFKFDFPLIE